MSPDLRGAAILADEGSVLAAARAGRWGEDVAALLGAADAAEAERPSRSTSRPRRARSSLCARGPPRSRSPSASRSPRCCSSTCARPCAARRGEADDAPEAASGPPRPRLRLRRRGRRLRAAPPRRAPSLRAALLPERAQRRPRRRLRLRGRALRRRGSTDRDRREGGSRERAARSRGRRAGPRPRPRQRRSLRRGLRRTPARPLDDDRRVTDRVGPERRRGRRRGAGGRRQHHLLRPRRRPRPGRP